MQQKRTLQHVTIFVVASCKKHIQHSLVCLWEQVGTRNLPSGIYLFKVNYGNIRTMYGICSSFKLKTREQTQWDRSGVFIIYFEPIFPIVLWCFHCCLWASKYYLGRAKSGTKSIGSAHKVFKFNTLFHNFRMVSLGRYLVAIAFVVTFYYHSF